MLAGSPPRCSALAPFPMVRPQFTSSSLAAYPLAASRLPCSLLVASSLAATPVAASPLLAFPHARTPLHRSPPAGIPHTSCPLASFSLARPHPAALRPDARPTRYLTLRQRTPCFLAHCWPAPRCRAPRWLSPRWRLSNCLALAFPPALTLLSDFPLAGFPMTLAAGGCTEWTAAAGSRAMRSPPAGKRKREDWQKRDKQREARQC